MNETTDDFDVLETPSNVLMYQGEQLVIKPVTVGQFPAFVRGVRPAMQALFELDTMLASTGSEMSSPDVAFITRAMDLVENSGDDLQVAMAIAVGKPVEFIAAGDLLEFTTLVGAVIRINRDFFGRPLGPLLAKFRK